MSAELNRPSPRDMILNAFLYFHATELDEESLIVICLGTGCPDRSTALRVLANLVENGHLSLRNNNGLKMYGKIPTGRAN